MTMQCRGTVDFHVIRKFTGTVRVTAATRASQCRVSFDPGWTGMDDGLMTRRFTNLGTRSWRIGDGWKDEGGGIFHVRCLLRIDVVARRAEEFSVNGIERFERTLFSPRV